MCASRFQPIRVSPFLSCHNCFLTDRGFAYSGEAGHDVLVMDSLSNRLQDALRRQLFAKGMFTDNLAKNESG